jgi:hypothetical protein
MLDSADEWRQEQIARNEASFRLINERLEMSLRRLTDPDEQHQFICECGSRSCTDTVLLTVDEYESVRARTHCFAVRPGHIFPEVERVVERHPRYEVVEKQGVAALISELTSLR